MTLELYAQPFFAAGAYSDFKEYAAPRTSRFVVYGRDAGTIAAARRADGLVDHYTIDPDGPGTLFETPIVPPLPEDLNFLP